MRDLEKKALTFKEQTNKEMKSLLKKIQKQKEMILERIYTNEDIYTLIVDTFEDYITGITTLTNVLQNSNYKDEENESNE